MIQATISFDVDKMTERLNAIAKQQIPFASSLTINTLLKEMKKNYQDEMKGRFENPVPFTLNGMFTIMSTKHNLEGTIGLKEFATKGNPVSKYLFPQIKGGPAYMTRFQKALRNKGILGPNQYAIPTQSDHLRMNRYGNVQAAQYSEILYYLGAFRDSSAFVYQNQAKKKKNPDRGYFAHTVADHKRKGGNFYPGIYIKGPDIERYESAVFWILDRIPNNQAKFPFGQIGIDYANANFKKVFGRSLARALY